MKSAAADPALQGALSFLSLVPEPHRNAFLNFTLKCISQNVGVGAGAGVA
jgi:hypothetical protein